MRLDYFEEGVPESGLPRPEKESGPAVYAVLQRQSAEVDMVNSLRLGEVCPMAPKRAAGRRQTAG
jgi:hypothetical protein